MIQGMQEIDKLKAPLQDIQIPLEVFELLDYKNISKNTKIHYFLIVNIPNYLFCFILNM